MSVHLRRELRFWLVWTVYVLVAGFGVMSVVAPFWPLGYWDAVKVSAWLTATSKLTAAWWRYDTEMSRER